MIGERDGTRPRARLRDRRVPRNRVHALLLAVAASLPACAALMGLDELPARPEGLADGGDADDARKTDATLRFCDADGGLFCDDFDDDAALGARWSGVPDFLFQNVNVTEGVASLATQRPAPPNKAAPSPPALLEAEGTRLDKQVTAILVHELAAVPSGVRGVEVEAEVRVLDVEDLRDGGDDIPDGGPDVVFRHPRLPVLSLFLIQDLAQRQADLVEAVFSSRYIALSSGELSLSPQRPDVYAVAVERDIVSHSSTFFIPITLAMGARAAILERQVATNRDALSCPETAAVAALWIKPLGGKACLAVPDGVANLSGKPLGVIAGLILNDRSRARVQLDNVRVVPIR